MNQKQLPKPKWEEMQRDVLMRIFSTFSLMDLALTVSSVCKSWRPVCYEPSIWKSLDLTEMDKFFRNPFIPNAWSDHKSSERFWRILKYFVNLSNGNLSTMVFHLFINIGDSHLAYTSRRTPKLKKLVLPRWSRLTEEGYFRAFKVWKGVESLVLPGCNISPYTMIKLIGKNLKNLSNLKIVFDYFDKSCATAILRFLPKLKALSLKGSVVERKAVEMILDNLNNLEELNLSHCFIDVTRYYPQYLHIMDPIYKTITRKASRLKKFYVCRRYNCVMCRCEYYYPLPHWALLRCIGHTSVVLAEVWVIWDVLAWDKVTPQPVLDHSD
ncbi:hypothetical protein ACH5RR_025381 [Cinchona calisaya]|uniref:F-box domain-containing protein n=1 Tax=Cinchona calisaya TaxID=153742 RepID=A0ABD2Z1X6_9GENT